MHFKRGLFPFFVVALAMNTAFASGAGQSGEDTLSVANPAPTLSCFQRPRFLDISYRTLPAIQQYPAEGAGDQDFEGNRLFEGKLSVPIVLKSDFKLVSQLRYKNESLNLGEINDDDRVVTLNNSGLALMFQWFYKENHFLGGHLGASLKSNRYTMPRFSSQLDVNTSIIAGRQRGEEVLALGVAFAHNLGRVQVLPVGIYERRLGALWHISAHLPKELTVSRA